MNVHFSSVHGLCWSIYSVTGKVLCKILGKKKIVLECVNVL